MFVLLACVALAAVGPAIALASHHQRHHRSRVHHARIRHQKFGTDPATPTTPTKSPDTAGTVKMFTPNSSDPTTGVLVITLTDGVTTETANITHDTEFECESSSAPSGGGMQDDFRGMSGDTGSGTSTSSDDDSSETSAPTTQPTSGGDDQGETGDDQGETGDDQGENGGTSSCGVAQLTPGTVVQEAEMSIGGSGANWDSIDLVLP
jgi:hypothetical protein